MKNILSFCACVFAAFSVFGQCTLSGSLACGDPLGFQTTVGATNTYFGADYSSCYSTTADFAAGDLVYDFTIFERQQVKITIRMLSAGYDLDLFLLNDCFDPQFAADDNSVINCTHFSVLDNVNTGILTETIDVILNPGTYYVVVDGYNSAQEGEFELSFTCDCPCAEDIYPDFQPQKMLCEDFSQFTNGGVAAQSTRWRLWDNAGTATSPDGTIGSFNNSEALHIKGTSTTQPDVLYNLEDIDQSSRYRLSWQMYVEDGLGAYYNIQRQMPSEDGATTFFAYQVSFFADGSGILDNDVGAQMATFTYDNGEWNDVMQIIDLTTNTAELWINDNLIFEWDYLLGGASTLGTLGAIDFFGPNSSNQNFGTDTDYWIDKICLRRAECPIVIIDPNSAPDIVCIKNGTQYERFDAYCAGLYTPAEMQQCFSVCDKGGPLVFRNEVYDGVLEPGDLTPGLLYSEPCVVDTYNEIGGFPENLYTDVYIFYNEELPGIGFENVEIFFNPDPNYTTTTTQAFVFFCECEYYSEDDVTLCFQECQGNLNDFNAGVLNGGNQFNDEGFYYITVMGEAGSTYDFNIVPGGVCDSGENITCGETDNDAVGNSSDFSTGIDELGNYASCYNGFEDYLGGEKVYVFNLDQPSIVTIEMTAEEGMGIFLYNYLCGLNCLDYAENDVELGGSASIDTVALASGTYYFVIDKMLDGGDQSFSVSLSCATDDDYFINLFDIEEDFVCPEDQTVSHTVAIENSLGENDLFKPSHLIQFMQNNAAGDDKINVPNVRQFWGATNDVLELTTYQDDPTDTDKCSYVDNGTDTIYVAVFDTEDDDRGGLCEAIYRPVGEGGATAEGIFDNNGVSVIEHLNYVSLDNFGLSDNFFNISPAGAVKSAQITTSLDWDISELPDSDWVTVRDNEGNLVTNGSKTKNIKIHVDPNLLRFPREMRLRVLYDGTPQIVRFIKIEQAGICEVPLASIDPVGTVCEGESVTLTASVANGLPGLHRYEWSTGDTTETVTIDNPQGSPFAYAVTVTDRFCDAKSIQTVQLTVNPAPLAPFNPYTEPVCQGATIPPLMASTNSGNFIQWYDAEMGGTLLSANNQYTPNIPANAPPATYTFWAESVDNATNCKSFQRTPYAIEIIPAPTVDAGQDIDICPNSSVILTPTVSGGNGSYAYDWNQNLDDIENPIAAPQTTTTYEITVTDNGGCTATDDVEVTVVALPTLSLTPQDATCGGSDGSISATLNGVAEPYTYLWNNGLTTATIDNLSADVYSLVVTDANGCTITSSATVETTDGPSASVSSNINAPICPSEPVTLTANGTAGVTFSYEWDDPNNSTSPTITVAPMVTTTYEVILTDNNGCTAVGQSTVVVNPAVQATAGGDNSVCVGTAANLQATGSGGSQNFTTYNWNIGPGATQTTTLLTQTTTFFVTITDSNGCTDDDAIEVTVNPLPDVQTTAQPTTCGDATGSATAMGSGGLAPYNFMWNDGSTSANISNRPAGFYTVVITDANGCTATENAEITNIGGPEVSTAASMEVVCEGSSSEVCATVDAGTPPYSYNWSEPGWGNAQCHQASPNTETPYSVTVTDANGCTNVASVTVQVEAPMTIDFSSIPTTTICEGDPITAFADLTGNYTSVEWEADVSGSFNDENSTLAIFSPDEYPDQIILTLTLNGSNAECPNTVVATQVITVNSLPTLVGNPLTACNEAHTQYTIQTTTDGAILTADLGNVVDLGNNNYEIQDIDINANETLTLTNPTTSCTQQISIFPPANCECNIAAPQVVNSGEICDDETIPPLVVSVGSGESVNWYADADGTMLLLENSATFTPTEAGTYYAQATDDVSPCESTELTPVTLTINQTPVADAGGDQTVCLNETVELSAENLPAGNYSFNWSSGNTPTAQDNEILITAPTEVELTVGQGNCFSTTTINIDVHPETSWDITINNPLLCNGAMDGILSIPGFPSGVEWSTGNTTSSSIENLSAGDYAATVTDNNGCTSMVQVSLEEPPPIIVDNLIINPDTNEVNGNGVLEIGLLSAQISGGTPNYNIQLFWIDSIGMLNLVDEATDIPPSNFLMDGLIAGEYVLNVFDANGCLVSTEMIFVEEIINGISDVEIPDFNIFPNPTTGRFNVRFDAVTTAEIGIEVMDLLGQTIYQLPEKVRGRKMVEIDLANYPKGVYWVRLTMGNQQLTRRIILQ